MNLIIKAPRPPVIHCTKRRQKGWSIWGGVKWPIDQFKVDSVCFYSVKEARWNAFTGNRLPSKPTNDEACQRSSLINVTCFYYNRAYSFSLSEKLSLLPGINKVAETEFKTEIG